MSFLSQLTIQQRTYLNISLTLVSIILIAFSVWLDISKLNQLNNLRLNTAYLETHVLELRKHEKDFLARNDIKYIGKFDKEIDLLKRKIQSLRINLNEFDIDISELIKFEKQIIIYQQKFHLLHETKVNIGLDPKSGLYGNLRNAVHQVESILKQLDEFELLSNMLQLRRAEKDFMLRLDLKYLNKFNDQIQKFSATLTKLDANEEVKAQLKAKMRNYQSDFTSLVQAQQKLGLDQNSGIQGEMRQAIHKTDESLSKLLAETKTSIKDTYQSTINMLIGIVSFVAVFTIGFGYTISKSIVNPINKLCFTINKIRAENNLALRIETKGKDEVSFLSSSFNDLQIEFATAIKYINQTTAELDLAMSELAEMTETTQQSMQDQQQQADLAATSTTELQSTVAEIARNTEAAAENAANTATIAEKGKKQVESTVNSINALATDLQSVNQETQLLAQDSITIGSILEVIRSIAEQTNLLALNAAIESARAGEQGRGFAVVADEVRSLAMRTQESTSQIESNIQSLQTRSSTIANQINGCIEISEQTKELANLAEELLQQIEGEVSSISNMNLTIASAVEEQNAVTEEVNQNVVTIRDISAQIYQMSERNTKISQNINGSLTELHQSVDKFKT